MNNSKYWDESEVYKNKAVELTKFLENDPEIKKYTEDSVKRTNMYDTLFMDMNEPISTNNTPTMLFDNLDTVSAIKKYSGVGRIAALNFASFKYPGGMFLKGSKAQEEMLCHNSNLYPILNSFKDTYYAKNRSMHCEPLYAERALYTPDVMFMTPPINVFADIITCAAPNLRPNPMISVDLNQYAKIITRRTKFIRNILYMHPEADIYILGAWGCGVFRNDARMVADAFMTAFHPCLNLNNKIIVFAVPGNDENTEAFYKAVDHYNEVNGIQVKMVVG